MRQPGGQSQTIPSEGRPIQFSATSLPGLYTVLQRAAGQTLLEEPFSINASDERESDVRPKPIALGSGRTLQANATPELVPDEPRDLDVAGAAGAGAAPVRVVLVP